MREKTKGTAASHLNLAMGGGISALPFSAGSVLLFFMQECHLPSDSGEE